MSKLSGDHNKATQSENRDIYTPTTDEVRAQWGYNYPDYDNTPEEFDRWLAQVKAEVWDECGQDIHGDHYPDTETYLRNPYREETE